MKTLRKVFGIVGTSTLMLGLLLFLIGWIVTIGEGMGKVGAVVATPGLPEEALKQYKGFLALEAVELVVVLLGVAGSITFAIIWLVKFIRRSMNARTQLNLGLLFKEIYAGAMLVLSIFVLSAGAAIAKAQKVKYQPDAMTIVILVFLTLIIAAMITGQIMNKYHRFAAKIIIGSGVGVLGVVQILYMCEEGIHGLIIAGAVFALIGFGLFSAFYVLPEPRPAGVAGQPKPRKIYDEYGYEIKQPQQPRPASRVADIPIEEEPVRPAPKPVQPAPAPRPAPQQAPQPKPVQPAGNPGVDITKELKKLKDLLDMGVISQEEYDAKRKKYIDML